MKTITLLGTEVNVKTALKYMISYVAFISILLLLDKIPQSFLYQKISWYGVIVGSGFLAGLVIAMLIAHNRNIDPDFMYVLILYIFPLAILGARIYYIIFSLDQFPTFYSMIAVWQGGLAIYGGLIGGAIALILACVIHKKNILDVLDIVIPALLIGQVIGRWGNFVNTEAYGRYIVNANFHFFPFGVYIDRCTQLAEGCLCGGSGWHLATFFYESLWNLVGFVLALVLIKKCPIKGILLGFYFVYYGLGRYLIEGLRMDSLYWGSFRVSQILSLVLMVVGVALITILLVISRRKHEKDCNISST